MDSKEGRPEHCKTYLRWAKPIKSRHSKPGAAPLAAWLGHEVIGLHKGGYGFLLGQSVFTSKKVSYKWPLYRRDLTKKHFVASCMDTGQQCR